MNTVLGTELKSLSTRHFVITSGHDPGSQAYVTDLFNLMGIEFVFFNLCSDEDVKHVVYKMVGHYDTRIPSYFLREHNFVKSKYARTVLMITYYIIWTQCRTEFPTENVTIWDESIVLNNNISQNDFAIILQSSVSYLPPTYDILLLGHFPQKFKTCYIDDGRSRLKCDMPVTGHEFVSDYLLKLTYGFPSGACIYTPRGIVALINKFEKELASRIIYPLECFIANTMKDLDVYCVNPSIFGQMLDDDSIVFRNVGCAI